MPDSLPTQETIQRDRKLDRALLVGYEDLLKRLISGLNTANHATATELAALPEAIAVTITSGNTTPSMPGCAKSSYFTLWRAPGHPLYPATGV